MAPIRLSVLLAALIATCGPVVSTRSNSPSEEPPLTSTWTNWAGQQSGTYLTYTNVSSEQEIVDIVRQAYDEGTKVSVVGSGHSYGRSVPIDVPESGHMIDLRFYDDLVRVDGELFTFQAGIVVERMLEILNSHGVTIPNQSGILAQTLGGVTGTNSHGSGNTQGQAAFVVGVRLITGNGTIIDVDAASEPDLLAACIPGLGVTGVFSEITVKTIPQFNVRMEATQMTVHEFLDALPSIHLRYDRFNFYWSNNELGWLATFTPTVEPISNNGSGCTGAFPPCVDIAYRTYSNYANWGFTGERPEIPGYNAESFVKYEDQYEFLSEWAAKFEQTLFPNVPEGQAFITHGIRFVRPDDGFLSMMHHQDSVALDLGFPTNNETVAEMLLQEFSDHSWKFRARMHWGKQSRYSSRQIKRLYPDFDRFNEQRERIDPTGVFLKNREYIRLFDNVRRGRREN